MEAVHNGAMDNRNFNLGSLLPLSAIAGAVLVLVNCAQKPAGPVGAGSFESVRPVLETSCVHCHGDYRLNHMPPMNTTKALAKLRGPGNWIMPGKPEHSLFYQVVIMKDEQPGAMPPTGHAISKADAEKLRIWIQAGAPLPEGRSITLRPLGEAPRSR